MKSSGWRFDSEKRRTFLIFRRHFIYAPSENQGLSQTSPLTPSITFHSESGVLIDTFGGSSRLVKVDFFHWLAQLFTKTAAKKYVYTYPGQRNKTFICKTHVNLHSPVKNVPGKFAEPTSLGRTATEKNFFRARSVDLYSRVVCRLSSVGIVFDCCSDDSFGHRRTRR